MTHLKESDVVFSGDIVICVVWNDSENCMAFFGRFQIDQIHLSSHYWEFTCILSKEKLFWDNRNMKI